LEAIGPLLIGPLLEVHDETARSLRRPADNHYCALFTTAEVGA